MSAYTKNLRGIAANLRTEGWDMRANAIEHAADRMDYMGNLLTSLMQGEYVVKKSREQKVVSKDA